MAAAPTKTPVRTPTRTPEPVREPRVDPSRICPNQKERVRRVIEDEPI